jgi:sec-independent protein translocase protein TatA
MPNLGGGELLIVLLIVLLVFGGTKVPQLARSLGQAQREFRKGSEDSGDDKGLTKDTKPSS